MPPYPALPSVRGAAPRQVADLIFPEILVIWALRRCTNRREAPQAQATAIAPEFSRAFGLARLEDSLAALAAVADSLATAARLPQAVSVIEDDRINATEEALLSVLGAFQQGEQAQARALSEWCLLPEGRARFIDGAGRLARALREAGHMIPYAAPTRPAPAAQSRSLPSARERATLEPAAARTLH